ncbi:MAG TPA: PKD domain-containing protein [Thermoplasmatales archaeon]|nr:PKD domain-containing protein [Thermoplasmatales archaeon]
MKKKIILIICLVFIAGVTMAGNQKFDYTESIMLPLMKTTTSNYTVVAITTLTPPGGVGNYGGQMDWSPDGEWITYDVQGEDGFTDIYKIRPDGTDNECLTCDNFVLPNRHHGQSAWHPSGRYLVFQAEKTSHFMDSWHRPCRPGGGLYNDLWVLDMESEEFYQLTDVRSGLPAGGSLHPHFSHDGKKLIWGDLEGITGSYGNWRMAVADFVTSPIPHLENVTYYEPAIMDNWYETHGFGPDDSWIYFTCTDVEGMNENAMDIGVMKLSNPDDMRRLTFSSGMNGEPAEWDEHAHLSPRNDVFAYVSSSPYGVKDNSKYGNWLKTDVWLMNINGSEPKRITYFNEPGYPEYEGDTICADNAWNPDGTKLAVGIYVKDTGETHIKIIEFSIDGNHPPDKPIKPNGPTSGKIGVKYVYTTSTTDPDGDRVYYKWDWGDNISSWMGPFNSNEIISVEHIWGSKGKYEIRVKAKDIHGEESPWSDSLSITIRKKSFRLLERFMERLPWLEQLLSVSR